jgi:hypothetical protein
MDTALKPRPPTLPVTSAEHLAHRKLKAKRTINDQIEDIHLTLIENEQYREFLEAVWDEQAVEGSVLDDRHCAAKMIRDRAMKANPFIAKQKLATIRKSLGVVLARYGFSRNERRNAIGGDAGQDSDE